MWENRKGLYFKNNQRGQAILELAVFGSFLIMLLGILLNYGLRYEAQQQVMQQAFRKALVSAVKSMDRDTPISSTQVVVNGKYVPDPSNAFAAGSVMPFSSSASVVRSYKLDQEADNDAEKPHVDITIDNQTHSYLADDIKNAKQPGRPGGLQPDYTQTTTVNSTMVKNETTSSISTRDNVNFRDTTQRHIVYKDKNGNIITDTVNSTISQNTAQQWQAAWSGH